MSENLDIAAILTDTRFNPRYLKTFAACLSYHLKPATIAELVATVKIPARTLQYQLASLRCLGIVTAPVGKNRLGLVTVHNPDRWDHNRAVHLGTPEPTANFQSLPAVAGPISPASDQDEFDAPILKNPPLPENVTRDYAAEVKILDSHPALKGRIRLSWLAYLERKYGAAMLDQHLPLVQLCDSFVHEFLGKNTGIAQKRLADPKTDWETTLQTHVMRHVAPTELRQRNAKAGAVASAQQKKFTFGQRRPAAPAQPSTPGTSAPVVASPPLQRLGATTPAAAALANPVLARLLKGVPTP